MLVVLMSGLVLPLSAQTKTVTESLTLDSCLSMARQRNCTIRVARLDIEKAKEVKHQMLTKFFPQVSGDFMAYHALHHIFGISPQDGNELETAIIDELLTDADGNRIGDELGLMHHGLGLNVTAMQPIFAGGRIVNGNRYAKIGIEAAELQAAVTEREVLEEVLSSYLLVQGLQEKVATVEAAMALLDSLDNVVSAGRQAGVLEPTDALRLELKKNEMRAKQMQLNNGIRLASKLLCLQVGIDYPEGGLVLTDVDDETATSTDNNQAGQAEYRLLKLNVESEEYKKKLTIGEALPMIGIGGAYFYGNAITNGTAMQLLRGEYSEYRHNGLLLLTAKIPLTDWWETGYKIRQHNIAIDQARIMEKDLRAKLHLREEKTEAEMLEAEALMRSDSAALKMAEENYRLAQLNYQAGLETMTNVLEANTMLLQAQNALTDRRISYLAAKRRLNAIR